MGNAEVGKVCKFTDSMKLPFLVEKKWGRFGCFSYRTDSSRNKGLES